MERASDEEYQRQLALFVRSSDEKPKLVRQLQQIVARLPRRERFLDVGAGGGDLTIPLSTHFHSTTIAEPNQVQVERFRRTYPDFQVQNVALEKLELTGRTFDFILCSHVLYYLDPSAWADQVDKLHHWLTPGGKVAVVMQSPAGDVARFFQHFNGYHADVIPLWDEMVARHGEADVEALYCRARIQTASLDDMVKIGLFLLIDKRFEQRKPEIADYHNRHHRTADGYCMHQGQITLVVTRPAPE